ncbi:MAG TPA: dUTP diphosphatase [Deltaproteobacteria bacterium]|nr:dUTP diphosphatase [Candidatus Binatota bacterium]HIL12745.1 dUTP diphosphatase [Deltaproteobacteria bacterium]
MGLKIAITRVGDVSVDLPQRMTEGSVGMDLRAALKVALELVPSERAAIPCGFAIAIPRGYEGQVRPRSGLALKQGLCVPNSPGTIDPDYRGEVAVIVANFGNDTVRIEPGQRVAQLVICPVAVADFDEVEELEPSNRGSGGFGHTGSA